MFQLEQYKLSYEISAIPQIIFAGLTSANEPYYFNKLEIPIQLKSTPLECRFLLFDPNGTLVELVHRVETASTVTAMINTIPLKMIKSLLDSNQSKSN